MNPGTKWLNNDTNELLRATLKLETLEEAQKFFRDLLTESEIIELGHRWKVVKMLSQKVPYTKIEKETGMSSTTIARIHKWFQKGMGGYKLILSR